MANADIPLCNLPGCSRPLEHPGGHGKPTRAEIRRLVPDERRRRPDEAAAIRLWHRLNKK